MEEELSRPPATVRVLAPYALDTAQTCEFLARAGIDARAYGNIEQLCHQLDERVGAVLVMEEVLERHALARLVEALAAQPRWSDLPVLVMVDPRRRAPAAAMRRLADALPNVTLITRPAHPVSLLSIVRAAVRAREHQYRLRDALDPFEQRYQRLAEALSLAVFVDVDGRIRYANPAAAALLGEESPRALIGQPLSRWIHPDFAEDAEARLAALARGGPPYALVQRWLRAGGEEIEVEVEAAPMLWGRRPAVRVAARAPPAGRGEAPAVPGVFASGLVLPEALAQLPLTLFAQDPELRYLWVHRPFLGEEAGRVLGRRDRELLPSGVEADALEAFKRDVLRSRRGAQGRFSLTLPGGRRQFDVYVAPLTDAAGAIVGLAGVAIDVSEASAREARLREQVEQFDQRDRRKNEFLAQLAHELRNPLTPIQNAAQVLRMQHDAPDAEQVRWVVEIVERQVRHLARLVEDLLDVARIGRGQVTLRREPVDLGRTVAAAIDVVRPLTTGRQQTLTYSHAGEPLIVHADPVRVTQIVVNLLNNAARYTPAGGHIALSARREGEYAVISVSDNGIGIAPEALERIFEPFERASRPAESGAAGLGLGLALVKHFAELHGGTVEAHSEGSGRGSEFTVRLPLAGVSSQGS